MPNTVCLRRKAKYWNANPIAYAFIERDLHVSAQNSINGKKGAELLAKRKPETVSPNIEVVVVAEERRTAKVE